MNENRKQPRTNCLVQGRINSAAEASAIECTVWDISKDGAKLLTDEIATLPDEIEIDTPFFASPRRAEICWRRFNEIGVRFLH